MRPNNSKRKMILCLAAGAGLATFANLTFADTSYTWVGASPGTASNPTSGTWATATRWAGGVVPVSSLDTELDFGGSGAASYIATDNILTAFQLNLIQLNSTSSALNTLDAKAAGDSLVLENNTAAVGPQILQNGSGAFLINPNIGLNNTVTVGGTGSGAVTLAGVLSGAGGFTLTDPNTTLILSNSSNTYNGATNINAGTLQLNNISAAAGSALNLNGGNLNLRRDTAGTFAPASTAITANTTIDVDPLTSAGGITLKLGNVALSSNTLNVTSSNNYLLSLAGVTLTNTAGATTILNPTTANLLITGTVLGNATATTATDILDLDGTATGGNLSGKISDGTLGGALGISKTNSGTWTISGTVANTYGGGTTVSNGTLILNKTSAIAVPSGGLSITGGTVVLGASQEIASANAVTISGAGALNLAGFNQTIKNITMNGGTVGPTGALTINTTGITKVNSGTISSTLITGTGDVTLGSGALISGATTLNGDVVFNGATTGATFGPGPITISANRNFNVLRGTDPVDLTISGAISSTASSGTQTISLLGKNGSTGSNGLYALNSVISNGTTGGQIAILLNDSGSSSARFAAANTYNGGTTINTGTALLAISNALDDSSGPLGPTSAPVILGDPTGTAKAALLISGANTFANNVTAATGDAFNENLGGAGDNNSAFTGSLTLGTAGMAGATVHLVSVTTGTNVVNFTGLIQDPAGLSGTAGSVILGVGASLGTVELSGANTYTGGTSLAFGTLAFGSSTTGSITSGPIGTGALSIASGTTIEAIGAQNIGNDLTLSSGNTAFTIAGSSALTIAGNVALNTGVNTITVTNSAITTITGNVGGNPATLYKAGPGTLVLAQANSYSGSTIVGGGILSETHDNAVPLNTLLSVGAGATLQMNANNNTVFSLSDLSGAGGTVDFGAGGNAFTLNGLAATTFSGSLIGATAINPASITLAGGNDLVLQGQSSVFASLSVQNAELDLNNAAGPALTNLTSASVTTNSLLLLLQSNQISSSATISVDSGGVFDLGGHNQTISGLTLGAGTVQSESGTLTVAGNITYSSYATSATALTGNVDLGAAVRTVFADSASTPPAAFTIAANISNGGLTKTGAATLNLAGVNTYTGATTVSAGKINVTGSLANTSVSVAANASFGGTGSVAGPVTISAGGNLDLVDNTISPFTLSSTLSLGSATLPSNLNLELNTVSSTTTFDVVNVAGALTVNAGGVVVFLTNLGATPSNGTYTILSYNPAGSTTSPNFTFSNGLTSETLSGVNLQLTNVSGAEQIVIGAAVNPMWTNGTANGSWNTAGNWSPSGILSGVGAIANFTSTGAGPVTLDAAQTVGQLNLNSATAYTLSAGTGGTLTLNDPSSPQINVSNGSHTISAPIILNNGVNVNFSNSSGLTVSNTITGPGTIAVAGAGTLTVGVGGVLPTAAALTLGTGAKVALAVGANATSQTVATLSIDTTTGSQLDLGNNILNITGTPITTIAGYINGTSTAGIFTSLADTHHNVGYMDNGSGGSEVRFTLLGDTNLDGSINFTDLLALAQHYGQSGAVWSTGDTNYDGTINFTDLLNLAQNYGQSVPLNSPDFSPSFAADWNLAVSEAAAVPEPASLGLLAIGATGLLARRRRNVSAR